MGLSAQKVDNGDDIQPWINRCLKMGGQWVLGGRIRLRAGELGGETRAACSDCYADRRGRVMPFVGS